MSAPTFTPGPWEAESGDIYQASTDARVASVYHAKFDGDVLLMAAAPEMREFVSAVLADPRAYHWHTAARAVLAKAEGK